MLRPKAGQLHEVCEAHEAMALKGHDCIRVLSKLTC
jgi:hypothetical protein